MIFTNLRTGDTLAAYAPAIQKAMAYLQSTDITKLEVGKHPIDGENMFAVVSDLQTRPLEDIPPEIHKRYMDVQYWQEEGETFGVASYAGNEPIAQAHPENDTWYLEKPNAELFITTKSGDVAVFFPWDVHRPGGIKGSGAVIRKCVVKVDMCLL